MGYIYQTVSLCDFMDAFRQCGRHEQFTRNALVALFEYLEALAEDIGEPVELDCIALCCEWSEYATAWEAARENSRFEPPSPDDVDPEADDIDLRALRLEEFEELRESEALEWLRDRTQTIEFAGGLLVCEY